MLNCVCSHLEVKKPRRLQLQHQLYHCVLVISHGNTSWFTIKVFSLFRRKRKYGKFLTLTSLTVRHFQTNQRQKINQTKQEVMNGTQEGRQNREHEQPARFKSQHCVTNTTHIWKHHKRKKENSNVTSLHTSLAFFVAENVTSDPVTSNRFSSS